MRSVTKPKPVLPARTPSLIELQHDLARASEQTLSCLSLAQQDLRFIKGRRSVWLLAEHGFAGFALRLGFDPLGEIEVRECFEGDRLMEVKCRTSFGQIRCRVKVQRVNRPVIRAEVWITPDSDLILNHWPRDLYPYADHDPMAAMGEVVAAQRGHNSGLVYGLFKQPHLGSFLYFQNFTRLNPYFELTGTTPDTVVGGEWPELGYLPPTSEQRALPANRETLISDALLSLNSQEPGDTPELMKRFVEHLADVYEHLEKPPTYLYDWVSLGNRTYRDLSRERKVRVRYWDSVYLRPYVDAEYPDSMCQLNVLVGAQNFENWNGWRPKLSRQLERGVIRFYSQKEDYLRRYLPNVGKDKDAEQIDTWYLFHPLLNLAVLASRGDEAARDLYRKSLRFAIAAARHFDYRFPVLFRASDFKVITQEREPGQTGQSDAPGIYAYVMLDAFEFFGEDEFLEEAKRSLRSVQSLGFKLAYQLNITAVGVAASVRMAKLTGEDEFLDIAHCFAASFFHNAVFWNSEIEHAKNYCTFMGASCLHDGPYMSMFECHESYEAFLKALEDGSEIIPEPLRYLMSEYCRYTMTRAWSYFPAHLPNDAVADQIRNGHIARDLALPLEDLYPHGKPAGTVGQEVYGSGAAFEFVAKSFYRLGQSGWTLVSEFPLLLRKTGHANLEAQIVGSPRGEGHLWCYRPADAHLAPPALLLDGETATWKVEPCSFAECVGSSLRGGQCLDLFWETPEELES